MKKMQLLSIMSAIVMLTGCGNSASSSTSSDSASGNTQSKDNIPQFSGYNLLWNDEFDGDELDDSIWSYDPHEPGWTNQELQEYTESTDNVFIRDGKLVLKAIKTEQNGKPYYTSGKIKSQDKKDFLYGKIVARAKVPEGKGLWPAIWMMPKDENLYGQWPKCGEIDIMEVLGSRVDTAYSTLHYGEPHGEQQGTRVLQNGSYADSFHEYSVEWEPGEIRFYVDGELTLTANDWFSGDANGNEKWGDLLITIHIVNEDKLFLDDDGTLETMCVIDWLDAIIGSQTTIDLYGEEVRIPIPRFTQNGGFVYVNDKGYPEFKNIDKRGRLKVNFLVRLPNYLPDDELDLIKEIKNRESNKKTS